MKKPILIANWKMNLSLGEREGLAKELKSELGKVSNKDIVVCPSTISLMQVAGILDTSNILLGSQDVFWEETGAYTGEVSPSILKDIDCRYAIIGHSERRQLLGETDEMVNKKIGACLDNELIPIFCIGETNKERNNNQTDNILLAQLRNGLKDVDITSDESIVIAYEPVWSIGTGTVVEPDELQRVLETIKQTLVNMYPLTIVNNNVRMIYGGSINPDNVSGFSQLGLLDGFLVGGASLDANKFKEIAKSL